MATPIISNDEVLKKYNALSNDLKEALFADSVTEKIFEIGKAFGLGVDKMGELADEIGLVILGITPTTDFIKNLSDRLGVDKEKAKAIAEDVNQKIFQTIRASLRKVHGLPPESPPPPAAIKPVAVPPKASSLPGELPASAPARNAPADAGGPKPTAPPIPPIFAKKVTPIDALLDKIDSGDSVIKPKTKIERVPPPAGGLPSSIRTMFQDARSFLKAKTMPEKSAIEMPKEIAQEKPVMATPKPMVTPPTPASIPIPAPATAPAPNSVILPKPPPPSPPVMPVVKPVLPAVLPTASGGVPPAVATLPPMPSVDLNKPIIPSVLEKTPPQVLNHDAVKSEIENVLGGKIKVDANSSTDPYREPIE